LGRGELRITETANTEARLHLCSYIYISQAVSSLDVFLQTRIPLGPAQLPVQCTEGLSPLMKCYICEADHWSQSTLMPRKGDLHINLLHALELLHLLPQTSSLSAHVNAGSYILHQPQAPLTGQHWPKRARRNTATGEGRSLQRFHCHHPQYVFVWSPYSTSTFVPSVPFELSYRIPGFHEQFSGVLQAYLVYSKTDKPNFDNFNYIIYFRPHLVHNWH
jgi:hypothetical protein